MTFSESTARTRQVGIARSVGLFGALLAVPVLLAATPAEAQRSREGASDRGTTASAPSSSPSVAPSAPRSAPAPSSGPSSSPSASAPSRGSSGSGGGSGARRGGSSYEGTRAYPRTPRGSGSVSSGSRPPSGGHHRPRRPHRRYHGPTWGSGTAWGWGGPWDWWWWGPGWRPYWGWGGVVVIHDYDQDSGRYARVDTDVSPEAAEVYLDGTYVGSADDFDGFPDHLYLEPGKYRLEFRHPSYETLVKELEVRPGHQVRLDDQMTLLPGKSRMEAIDPERRGTPLGRVFGKPEADRDGRNRDRTGRFEAKADRDEDELEELEDLEDLEDREEDVPPPAPPRRAGPPTRPDVRDLEPAERGRLRFEVEPEDAAVYLDDRYVGTGEELASLRRGIPVGPGKHTVTVVRPGYGTKTVDVEAKPGAAIDVVVELEK